MGVKALAGFQRFSMVQGEPACTGSPVAESVDEPSDVAPPLPDIEPLPIDELYEEYDPDNYEVCSALPWGCIAMAVSLGHS